MLGSLLMVEACSEIDREGGEPVSEVEDPPEESTTPADELLDRRRKEHACHDNTLRQFSYLPLPMLGVHLGSCADSELLFELH